MANAPPFADPDLRQRLIQYLTAVLPELGHKDRRPWAAASVRGFLLEGERKSIEPMAKRLPDGNVQAMQHFIGKSPWPYEPVRRQLAQVLCADIGPRVVDHRRHRVSQAGQAFRRGGPAVLGHVGQGGQLPNRGEHAPCHDSGEYPIDWALYLPEAWATDPARCARAGVPAVSVVYRPKWQLALELIDHARQWELTDQRVVADAGYGNIAEFRAGLQERQLPYAVGVESGTGVWTRYPQRRRHSPKRGAAGRARAGTMEAGARAARWTSRARFARGRLHYSGVARREPGPVAVAVCAGPRLAVPWVSCGQAAGGRTVAPHGWPADAAEPTKYWLVTGPATAVAAATGALGEGTLARVEQDYEQLKSELGLDHFEGRRWLGWHHHVTMTTMAYGFLVRERLRRQRRWEKKRRASPPCRRCGPNSNTS